MHTILLLIPTPGSHRHILFETLYEFRPGQIDSPHTETSSTDAFHAEEDFTEYFNSRRAHCHAC